MGNTEVRCSHDSSRPASRYLLIAGLLCCCTGIIGNAYAQVVIPPAGIINTVAGNGTQGYSGDGGQAISAEIAPGRVAVDNAGNIYIADFWNFRIRKVTAATGVISTVAGDGTQGYSGDGGAATSAELNYPLGVAVNGKGDIYFVDTKNYRVRKVTAATGIITTVAGNGIQGYSGDGGAATNAEIAPDSVALDMAGNIYIGDSGNNRIRKVTASTGTITTVAGNGTQGYSGDGGAATNAELSDPAGVAVDTFGNIYIADLLNARIRKVTASTGVITTVAGNGNEGYSGDGGSATSAEIYDPATVAVDSAGNIFIGDASCRVRKVTAATGIITTVAGNGVFGYSGDGGAATNAEMSPPEVALDGSANIFIADQDNNRIRVVGGTSPLPTPPANATEYPNLQTDSGSGHGDNVWQQCTSENGCAGTQESGSGSLTFGISSPSLSGSAMKQTSAGRYFNTLYYNYLGCPSIGCGNVANMLEDVWLYPADTNYLEQLEFDPDLFTANYIYKASIACRLVGTNAGFWQLWNTATNNWVATSYPCTASTIAAGTWHHFQLYVTFNTSNHTYAYQTFVFDGATVFHDLGTTYNALAGTSLNTVNVEQQIDDDGNTSATNTVYYDDYNLWVW